MKFILLMSALIVSAIPVQAQQQRLDAKEESIFHAGSIFGAGMIYCRFVKEGKVSDKERQEQMSNILNNYKTETVAKDYGDIIDAVYASAMVCD
mgnify:CR=1 FL=1